MICDENNNDFSFLFTQKAKRKTIMIKKNTHSTKCFYTKKNEELIILLLVDILLMMIDFEKIVLMLMRHYEH